MPEYIHDHKGYYFTNNNGRFWLFDITELAKLFKWIGILTKFD